MSDAQVKAAGKLVRNVCQPKNKATDEDIDKMHQGDWNIDHTAMCYMHCVLTSQKLITKENNLDYDVAMNAAKTKLPVTIRDGTLVTIEQCKDSAKTLTDKCVAAYEISKCLYEANPQIYFLP
ncbi:general odorant-binding protein 72-like [Zophobas morio]